MSSKVKQAIRERVWGMMEGEDIARFPRPVHGTIPNFEGAEMAAARLADLDVFKGARVVKVNPDSPQHPVRERAISSGKRLLMPTPRLRRGFILIEPDIPRSNVRYASTIRGAFEFGKRVRPDAMPKVDLVIVGSVAVTQDGARLGKGGGYSEMEYAILRQLGLADGTTPVATTVHDAQVIHGEIPLEAHDLSVDIIVTPTRALVTGSRAPKPTGILWEVVSEEMKEEMPILRSLESMI